MNPDSLPGHGSQDPEDPKTVGLHPVNGRPQKFDLWIANVRANRSQTFDLRLANVRLDRRERSTWPTIDL